MTTEALSVILYLGVICSPCSYTEVEIENIYDDNQTEILDIKDDEGYLNQVVNEYEDQTEQVSIDEDYDEN